jgi:hypothetical protein
VYDGGYSFRRRRRDIVCDYGKRAVSSKEEMGGWRRLAFLQCAFLLFPECQVMVLYLWLRTSVLGSEDAQDFELIGEAVQ